MEQSTRLSSAIRHVFPPHKFASGYICHQCRHRSFAIARNARIFPLVSTSFRRYASSGGNENSLTERIRRQLWKTEPPGQKDPYNPNEADALQAHEAGRAEEEKVSRDEPTKLDSQGGQYVEATTGDGLERIGGPTGWWEEAWDKVNTFEGYMAPSRMESKEDIAIAIHRALVEVYTVKEAGLSIVDPSWEDADYDSDWGAVGFHQHGNGTVEPIYPSEEIRQKILHHLTNPESEDDSLADSVAEDVEDLETEESDEKTGEEAQATLDQSQSSEEGELEGANVNTPEDDMMEEDETNSESPLTDKSWLNVPFDDIDVKFMVLKRVMQLTGIRIPDPAIPDLTTAKILLGHLVRKPKPKKLADRLVANEELFSLPNLHIMDRRYTPIDREKEIGRWKIIEKELVKRDLPVTGRGY